jgi:hypothetical protein
MRESIGVRDHIYEVPLTTVVEEPEPSMNKVLQRSKEVEVVRWGGDSMGGDVWMNNGSIEGKMPITMMNKRKQKRKNSDNRG